MWRLIVAQDRQAADLLRSTARRPTRRAIKEPTAEQRLCSHPANSIFSGANQYGRYRKCMKCKLRLFYQAHDQRPLESSGPPHSGGKKGVKKASAPDTASVRARDYSRNPKDKADVEQYLAKIIHPLTQSAITQQQMLERMTKDQTNLQQQNLAFQETIQQQSVIIAQQGEVLKYLLAKETPSAPLDLPMGQSPAGPWLLPGMGSDQTMLTEPTQ